MLQTLARRHPLFLVLDDLQWADAGSISLLFHLGRRLAGSRILVAAAYRPDAITPQLQNERHPLELVVNELQRISGQPPIDLDACEGRQFVEALLDTESNRLGASFREQLVRHTEGNPLFTVELLRGLKEQGDLVRDADDALGTKVIRALGNAAGTRRSGDRRADRPLAGFMPGTFSGSQCRRRGIHSRGSSARAQAKRVGGCPMFERHLGPSAPSCDGCQPSASGHAKTLALPVSAQPVPAVSLPPPGHSETGAFTRGSRKHPGNDSTGRHRTSLGRWRRNWPGILSRQV